MNVLSLFTGIGGIDLGLERAGMTIVGQVEIDPYCNRILARHWPHVPRHDNVITCIPWWQDQERPHVDLISGGFPCQPVSVAGLQRGSDDERWLWPAMAQVIRALRPRYVFLENVPGLLARGMGDVLGELAACGYDADWDCISAEALGAPHIRERIWVVAHTDADSRRLPEQPERHSQPDPRLEPPRRDHPVGLHEDVAHPDGEPRRPRRAGDAIQGEGRRDARRSGLRPGAVADPDRLGRDGRPRIFEAEGPRRQLPAERSHSWWAAEPDVGRVAHGIPHRVDRLRALGNAVVPQVVEHIGRLIITAEETAA